MPSTIELRYPQYDEAEAVAALRSVCDGSVLRISQRATTACDHDHDAEIQAIADAEPMWVARTRTIGIDQ